MKKILRIGLLFLMEKTSKLWPEKMYLKLRFILNEGPYWLDLNNPKTFNEKLNWSKIYIHDPFLSKLADKYEVKHIVKEIIGKEYVVQNYGVWESFDDINFNSLPSQFVLKSTHDSGGAIICRDKTTFDVKNIRKYFKNVQKRNYYWPKREWVYKNIRPRIIVDEYLDDQSGRELRDYKFWCFNGKPEYMYITNKGKNIEENFYDMDFNPVDINHGFPRTKPEYTIPDNFDLMKKLCFTLLEKINMPFVRIDFFDVCGKIYFGEFTFYDWAGLKPFTKIEWDIILGQKIFLDDYCSKQISN